MKHIKKSIFIAAMACWAINAHAQWSTDPTVNTPIATALGNQQDHAIASDGHGGVIVAWQDDRNGSFDIYAQRIDSQGAIQWTVDGIVVCDSANDQLYPQVVSDGAGGAIVVWEDHRGNTPDVYCQRIDSAGVVQWISGGVAVCSTSAFQVEPIIVTDGANGAIITWRDDRSGQSYDIYSQRISSTGQAQWVANGVGICLAGNAQDQHKSVADETGGAIVVWRDRRGGSRYDIYAQRVDSMGAVLWTSNGVAVCTAVEDQEKPVIAHDGSQGAIISWADFRGANNFDIYAQRLSTSGQPNWTQDGILVCNAAADQATPTVVGNPDGSSIVAWGDRRGGNSDIYAQAIDPAGNPQWLGNGIAICTATDDQSLPFMVSDGVTGAIVAWTDRRGGSSNNDIYSQRIDSLGVAIWTANGIEVCSAMNGQYGPMIVEDEFGGGIFVWRDQRGGIEFDIYAQKVCGDGALGGATPNTPVAISGQAAVCPGSSNTYAVTAVNGATSYQWSLPSGWTGNSTTNSITAVAGSTGGTISLVALNECGSSPSVALNVSIVLIDTTLSSTSMSLVSNQAGASYQWLDCDNGNSPISGANSQSYSPTASGSYAVAIDLGGCVDTSACLDFLVVGMEDEVAGIHSESISIYPNPTQGAFTIETESVAQKVILTDLLGKTILELRPSGLHATLNLQDQNNGIYLVRIVSKKGSKTFKVVKTE